MGRSMSITTQNFVLFVQEALFHFPLELPLSCDITLIWLQTALTAGWPQDGSFVFRICPQEISSKRPQMELQQGDNMKKPLDDKCCVFSCHTCCMPSLCDVTQTIASPSLPFPRHLDTVFLDFITELQHDKHGGEKHHGGVILNSSYIRDRLELQHIM